MTRDDVILEIERFDPVDELAIENLKSMLRSRAAEKHPRSLANDVEQALTCFLMLQWPASFFLCKKVRKSIQLSWRLVALVFVLGFFIVIEFAILFVLYSSLLDDGYAYAAILFTMLFQLPLLMWWARRYRRRHWVSEIGIHGSCASCRYNLTNEDSALGDVLWVGPVSCPKCNRLYPAVH